MWTFETQWPLPFARGWDRSQNTFHTQRGAMEGLAAWMNTCADNDVLMEGRLVDLDKEEEK